MPDTTEKNWNGAMSATHFMRRFGGSCRTKHTLPMPTTRLGWLRLWLFQPDALASLRRRPYPLPPAHDLPAGFISQDPWEAEYLFLVAAMAERGIVEIGRRRGGSTFVLASANIRVPIWSIDKDPKGDDELQRYFKKFRLGENVQLLVGHSNEDEFPQIGDFDLVYVDGNHRYEGCMADLEAYYPRLAPGGSMLIHDCYGAREVQRAVLDFVAEQGADVDAVRTFIPAAHWHTEHGSLAHLRKPIDPDRPAPPPRAHGVRAVVREEAAAP